jgi:hypothetical protein
MIFPHYIRYFFLEYYTLLHVSSGRKNLPRAIGPCAEAAALFLSPLLSISGYQ